MGRPPKAAEAAAPRASLIDRLVTFPLAGSTMAAQDRQVAGKTGIEITGPEPWPVGFSGGPPRSSAIPVRILIAPQPRARTSIAELRGRSEVVVGASDPSAVEAAV